MKKTLAVVCIFLSAGCAHRLQYDYFEPSGLDTVVSMPPQAPKNVAKRAWSGSELEVRSEVIKDRIQISLRLFIPPGAGISFSGDRAKVAIAGAEEEIKIAWSEWTLKDGVGAKKEVPFDVSLKPQSFRDRPLRTGIEDMGRYETTFYLPDRYSSVREFSLVLPSPKGSPEPLRISFVRKTADYRVFVELI